MPGIVGDGRTSRAARARAAMRTWPDPWPGPQHPARRASVPAALGVIRFSPLLSGRGGPAGSTAPARARGQWLRSALISSALLIEDRPLMPISRARFTRSALDQSW